MPLPFRVMVITDWSLAEAELLPRLEAALSVSPLVALQHRHPGATTRDFLREAELLATLCAKGGNELFVNGRADVALAVGANLHLPANAPTPKDVRDTIGIGRFISTVVHDESEVGNTEGADLALVSPVFTPGSKPADRRAPLGVAGFERLATRLDCPAFALGGMTPGNLEQLVHAQGVACVSAILKAADPAREVSALLAVYV